MTTMTEEENNRKGDRKEQNREKNHNTSPAFRLSHNISKLRVSLFWGKRGSSRHTEQQQWMIQRQEILRKDDLAT